MKEAPQLKRGFCLKMKHNFMEGMTLGYEMNSRGNKKKKRVRGDLIPTEIL